MEDVKMPVNLVNAVLQYLGTRPFVEVAQLIQAIQQVAAEQAPPAEEKAN